MPVLTFSGDELVDTPTGTTSFVAGEWELSGVGIVIAQVAADELLLPNKLTSLIVDCDFKSGAWGDVYFGASYAPLYSGGAQSAAFYPYSSIGVRHPMTFVLPIDQRGVAKIGFDTTIGGQTSTLYIKSITYLATQPEFWTQFVNTSEVP